MKRFREKRDRSALPPRKRDWIEGNEQIGLFVRTPDGSVIEVVWHNAPKEIRQHAALMVAERLRLGAVADSPAAGGAYAHLQRLRDGIDLYTEGKKLTR